MNEICILCVDDEPEVLEAVERDLSELEDDFPLEIASSAIEAKKVLERVSSRGDEVGVIFCDHVMPEVTGVEFLTWMRKSEEWNATKKALLTGQAGLEATVDAVNNAGLDRYVSKPWVRESLVGTARSLLTDYVIQTNKELMPFLMSLDTEKLSEAIHSKGLAGDD
ncbi:MAG: response regulator [Verrucomicrobiota bacterium]